MKRILEIALIVLMASISTSSFAKEKSNLRPNKYGPYITNKAFHNVFIGVGGGTSYLLNGYNEGGFLRKQSLNFDISLGKWITPNIGVRLQVNGMNAGGYTVPGGMYSFNPISDELAQARFHTRLVHGDFLLNISNLFSGYREERFWDFIPFVGFGYAGSYLDNQKVNNFAGYVGLLNTLRVCKVFDFTIEAKYMMAPGTFDGEPAGTNSIDGLAMLTAGVSFNIGNKNFQRRSSYVPESDYLATEKQLKAVKQQLLDKQNENVRLSEALDKALTENNVVLPRTKTKTVQNDVMSFAPVALFFPIGQATLNNKELVNLEFIVKQALKKDPKHVFELTGMADSSTGSAKFNQKLSEKRVEYVKNIMVQKYNIKASRIKSKANGSTSDMFDAPELNRIVIVQ